MKKYLLLLMCILPLLCACWKDILVISLTINATELTLTEGETYRLEAMVTPSDATDKSVTWESSAPEIARVENGVVTALKKGEAVITAKTVDGGKTASCQVEVLKKVQSISLSPVQLTLAEGETYRLEAIVTPSDAANKSVTWESSSPEIAKVENGVVTALKKGEAVITVKTVDGGKTASCKINVDTNNSFDNPLTDEDWDW